MRARLSRTSERGIFAALLLLAAALYALYFVHLQADFPTVLPQVDWARYTDEGWYSSAALHHAQGGQWYTPNGFNAAVALPLWPLLLRAWFAVTGPGMVAARTLAVLLFGATNVLLYMLLRPLAGRVLAAAAVVLTLSNPFCYGFNRLAIVEPLAGFLFLLALWVARPRANFRRDAPPPFAARSVWIGLLLTALVLTKSTAVLLAPAILVLLWQSARAQRHLSHDATHTSFRAATMRIAQEPRAFLAPAIATAVALLLWLVYLFVLVRPHHAADYHHLFSVNRGHASGHTLPAALAHAVGDGTWMGGLLYALTLLLIAASLRFLRELWRVPLFGSALLALFLPIAFIGWHTWFLPHYYQVCVPAMMIVLMLGVHALARRAHTVAASRGMRVAHTAAMLVVEAAFALMLLQTLSTALHPQYTYAAAANDIARRMRADTGAAPKLLAASGDDIALMTGIHAVNPEWPMGGLPALITQEQPGWYGGYLPWDAKQAATVQQLVSLEEVARYPIEPDPDHQVFVLYRIRR